MGAGPAGLFAAFQSGLMGMSACLIDVLDFIGGQCAALYPEKSIYDIPAYPVILAADLIKNLEKQMSPFAPELLLGQQVIEISKDDDSTFLLRTKSEEGYNAIKSKAVILTTGGGAFKPNKPPIAGIEAYENKSVFYAVNKKNFFVGKDIVICGGGDAAVDWAVILSEVAKSVTLVHRRDKFRCVPESLNKLTELGKNGKIKIEIPYQIVDLEGQNGQVQAVQIAQGSDRKRLKADAVLLFFGLMMSAEDVTKWGIKLDKKYIKTDPATMATNMPGIYAAGDITIYPGKLKLILTGFAEAALACRSIYYHLNPEAPVHLEHSTSSRILISKGEGYK